MRRLQALAMLALALAVAGPASAITGWGVSKTLRTPGVLTAASGTSSSKSRTCQAAGRDKKRSQANKLKLIAGGKSPAVVACEQPPKSELIAPSLKSSTVTALNTVG